MTDHVHPICSVRAELGEGPVWDARRGVLWFVDILGRRIHRYDPITAALTVLELPQEVGAVAVSAGGGLVAAVRDGIALLDAETGAFELLARVESEVPRNRMNDAKCDRRGRLWAGTMAFDATPGAGTLYRCDPGGAVSPILQGLSIANGIAWSADDRTMYLVDSSSGIDALDFDLENGTVRNRRRFVDVPTDVGLPDGLTIDAEDHVWVAIWGGSRVQRYTREGELEREIAVPASQVSSVTFGGPALDDLYITSAWTGLSPEQRAAEPLAGSCFVCRPGITGTPTEPFGP